MRFHCIALLLCITLVSCVSAIDLSGTWTVVIPSQQATGTATIEGQVGTATITTTKFPVPFTLSERFTIKPAGENRYLIACTYGEYAVRYMSEEDYKESLQGQPATAPYAYKTIEAATPAPMLHTGIVAIDEV
jgi:hypothetical protein